MHAKENSQRRGSSPRLHVSDVLASSANLQDPARVGEALLDFLGHEVPDCMHNLAFFAGPCALGLPLSMEQLSSDRRDVPGHAAAYAHTAVAWNRWSVAATDRNKLHEVQWRDNTPLGHLFRAQRIVEYRRMVLCVGDQAIGLFSTCSFSSSAPPAWEQIAAIVDTMLPALRMSALARWEPERAEPGTLAYLSPTGSILACEPTVEARRVAELAAQSLQRGAPPWHELETDELRVVACTSLPTPDITLLRLQHKTRTRGPAVKLSERDQRLVEWLARGLTNKEIAAIMGMHPTAVKRTLERLYARTGAGGRTELIHLLG